MQYGWNSSQQNICLWVAALLITLTLSACGGGGDGNGNESSLTARTTGNKGSVVTSNEPTTDAITPPNGLVIKTITTTDSAAGSQPDELVIEKTFKSGVHLLIESNNIVKLSDTQFEFKTLPNDFNTGSVFTYQDAPWVVTQVSKNDSSISVVTVRPADFNEVLLELKVNGNATMVNIDPSRMIILSDPSVQALTANDVDIPAIAAVEGNVKKEQKIMLATAEFGTLCNLSNDAMGKYNGFKCSIKRPKETDVVDLNIALKGAISIKDLKLAILSNTVNPDTGMEYKVETSLGFDISSSQNFGASTAALKKTFSLVKVIFPVQFTLGFNRFEFPIAGDVKGPGISLGVNVNGTFPYKNGFNTPTGTLAVFNGSANNSGNLSLLFKDNFFGIRAGVAYVQTLTTIFKPDIIFFPDADKTLIASEGIFGKAGAKGDLTFDLSPLCFKYKLNIAGGGGAEVKFRNPIRWSDFIEKSFETIVDAPFVLFGELPNPCVVVSAPVELNKTLDIIGKVVNCQEATNTENINLPIGTPRTPDNSLPDISYQRTTCDAKLDVIFSNCPLDNCQDIFNNIEIDLDYIYTPASLSASLASLPAFIRMDSSCVTTHSHRSIDLRSIAFNGKGTLPIDAVYSISKPLRNTCQKLSINVRATLSARDVHNTPISKTETFLFEAPVPSK